MKDIEIVVTDQDASEELRTITGVNVGWLLGAGWMFYLVSLVLNLVYYLMHPSSPEMWTWGAEEKLEEWTPPGEKVTETRKQYFILGQKNQTEASQMEMAELLPQESEGNMQINDFTN